MNGSGLPITARELNSSDLSVSVSGNTVTVTAISGGNHRGTYTVRVTPTSCGSPVDFSVTVAK
jgi:hypothetical protein